MQRSLQKTVSVPQNSSQTFEQYSNETSDRRIDVEDLPLVKCKPIDFRNKKVHDNPDPPVDCILGSLKDSMIPQLYSGQPVPGASASIKVG